MTKYNEITNTFAAGELSPKVHNRTDIPEYSAGLEEMLNFVPATTGGAFRRMGSEFLVDLDRVSTTRITNTDIDLSTDIITLYSDVDVNFIDTDVNTGTDEITIEDHGIGTTLFLLDEPVRFIVDTGAPPAPLVTNTIYFGLYVDDNTLKLQATAGGGAINITTTGSGTFHLERQRPHGFSTNTELKVENTVGSILPSPLVNGIKYFIIRITDYTFKLSFTFGGAAIDLTSAGLGQFDLILYSDQIGLVVRESVYSVDDILVVPFRGLLEDYIITIKTPRNSIRNATVGTGPVSVFGLAPIRVFSRKYNNNPESVYFTIPVGYEQKVNYPRYFDDYVNLYPRFYYVSDEDRIDIEGFRYVQFGDDMYVTHASSKFAPMVIRLSSLDGTTGRANFEILPYLTPPLFFPFPAGDADFFGSVARAMPFQPQNTNKKILIRIKAGQPATSTVGVTGGVSGAKTLTTLEAVDDTIALIPNYFIEEDIGTMFQIQDTATATEGIFIITSIGETGAPSGAPAGSQAIASIVVSGTAGMYTPSFRWKRSSFNQVDGFPRAIGFYQSRLHFGSTLSQPVSLWASDILDLFTMKDSLLVQDLAGDVSKIGLPGSFKDNYPFAHLIKSKKISGINWLIDDDEVLRVGTPENDFIVTFDRGGSSGYSRDNKESRPQSGYSTSSVQPIFADGKILFLNLDGSRVRSIDSRSRDVKYLNQDFSALADHMRYHPASSIINSTSVNASEFVQIYWQGDVSTLWCVNSRNYLTGFTLNANQGVAAWHQHNFGGLSSVQSVCSAFNPDSRNEDLICVISREVNGENVTYIESVGEIFNHNFLSTAKTATARDNEDKPRYLDCFVKITTATASKVISGVNHLEGETVSVIYNGKYEEDLLVTNGSLTIREASDEVIVGYKYTSRIKTLSLDRGQTVGSSRGNISRVDRITISLYNSASGKVADEEQGFNSMELTETELFTGDIRHDISQSSTRSPKIIIETNKPLPLNILGITTRGISYDG